MYYKTLGKENGIPRINISAGMEENMLKKIIKSGMAVILAITMVILPVNLGSSTAYAAVNYDDTAKKAQQLADTLVSIYGETSVQYALMDNGEIVLSGSSGVYSKEDKSAVTKETMYGIGSVSKVFTAAAVMKLTEEGKVNLDAPVIKYLPEFKMADKRYKDITVRMLLNHSSGLMGSTFGSAVLFDDPDTISMDSLLEELKTQRLKADPGAFSVYCNDGFSLAQLLVEKVSKMSFSEYIADNFSAPLGMKHTKTPLDQFDRALLAKTYMTGSDTALPVEYLHPIGAGGIYSSAEDLCRFAQAFLYHDDGKVLSDQTAAAMTENEYLKGMWCPDKDSSFCYGLGWDSVNTYPFTEYGIKALVKGGDSTLYHGSLVVLPEEGMAMAVLSSGGSSAYNQMMIQTVLLNALLAKGSISAIHPDKTFELPVKAEMPADEKENAGYYVYLGGIFGVEINDNGVLSLKIGSRTETFVYTGEGKFTLADGSATVSFEKESNGNTYLYVLAYGPYPYLGQSAAGSYQGQKITDNKLSKKVEAAWEKREGKKYFAIEEKYSSEAYTMTIPATSFELSKEVKGYVINAKIINSNLAQMQYEIPGQLGRDLADFHFITKDKVEYLDLRSALYVSDDVVKPIATKASFTVSIGKDGYAQWFTIGNKAEKKNIRVSAPKKASFSVYDKDGACVFSSLTTGIRKVTLPKDGYIVFAGEQGSKFTVKYVK